MGENAKWTFMVYLAGDNNLSEAGESDLREMSLVGSTTDVNIVAEFDRIGDQHRTKRYFVQQGDYNEVDELGETDSGDPEMLLDFITWAAKDYPADRYALILWNHGGGWEPLEMDRIARVVGSRDYSMREVGERQAGQLRRVLFRPTLESVFSLASPEDRAICSDDGTGHSLDTVELGRVLATAVEKLGQSLDLLGMDACLMSNLEVAYQVQHHVKYIVASEDNEPNEGWPYNAVLKKLIDKPDLETTELATHIVHAYIKSYIDRDYTGSVTQSALDLSKVNLLVKPLDSLAKALIAHMPKAAWEIYNAQRHSNAFWHNTLWDIATFSEELEKSASDDTVCAAARDVRTALKPDANGFVLADSHNGARVDRCGGVTVYLTPPLKDISRYYADLDYARDSRWLEMLRAYHAA